VVKPGMLTFGNVSYRNWRSPKSWASFGSRVQRMMQMCSQKILMVQHLKNALRLLLDRMSTWKIRLLLSKEDVRRCLMVPRRAPGISIKERFSNANLVEQELTFEQI
jgi:hypothetical protein